MRGEEPDVPLGCLPRVAWWGPCLVTNTANPTPASSGTLSGLGALRTLIFQDRDGAKSNPICKADGYREKVPYPDPLPSTLRTSPGLPPGGFGCLQPSSPTVGFIGWWTSFPEGLCLLKTWPGKVRTPSTGGAGLRTFVFHLL